MSFGKGKSIESCQTYPGKPGSTCKHGYCTIRYKYKSSWKPGSPHCKLAAGNKGPVGLRHSGRVPDKVHFPTTPEPEATPQSVQSGTTGAGAERDCQALLKRSGDRAHCHPSGRFFVDTISSPKEGRWCETSGQPQKFEHICRGTTFQNGGDPHPQKSVVKERLASKGRPEGCILFHPSPSESQEISVFPSQRQAVPIQLPSLWSGVSPVGLYQDPKASSSSRSGAGDAIGSLHRRHSPDGGVAGERSRSSERLDLPIAMLRFYNKQREDDFGTVPDTGVPGIHVQHSDNGASTTARETQKNSGGVSETSRGGASVSPRPLQVNWQNECSQSSNTASSTVLQTPTNGSSGGSENIRSGLRGLTRPVCRQQRRADLVGYSHDQVEWQDDVVGGTRHGDRIRRVEPGMGCALPGHRYGRSLDLTRGGLAHKLPGIAGSNTSAEDVREERDALISATQNRQHDGCCIYQQPRGDGVKEPGVPNTRAMDVVPGEEYSHPSAVPSRQTESAGRSGIQRDERPIRLEIGSGNIPKNQQAIRAAGSGLVCIEADPPVPSLFQLAARSICRSHRCFPARLDETERVCQPPLEPDCQGIEESKDAGSTHTSDNPGLEDTAVVFPTAVHVDRLATPSTSSDNQLNRANTPASRMEHLRGTLSSQGLSDEATQLVLGSWRAKTNKSYDSLFGRWNRWCNERGSDPFSGPVSEVANFLAGLYKDGYQYNSVNAYRSAISSVHEKVDGLPVGQHPLVTRLVKGVFNARPPIPRYSSTWDVQTVLNYLEKMENPDKLSLKLLTLKTVFIMAITRPSRSADLSQLDKERMRWGNDGVSFLPTTLAKQSRQGKPIKEFFFPSFPPVPALCPVKTLQGYLRKTEPLRGVESRLFVSFIRPHKAITSSTIARWLKTILQQAGVDIAIFGAHSTRGASASAAARGGITTEDILKAANWSSESVFQTYYHKEVDKAAYGRAVIRSNSSE